MDFEKKKWDTITSCRKNSCLIECASIYLVSLNWIKVINAISSKKKYFCFHNESIRLVRTQNRILMLNIFVMFYWAFMGVLCITPSVIPPSKRMHLWVIDHSFVLAQYTLMGVLRYWALALLASSSMCLINIWILLKYELSIVFLINSTRK